MIKKKLWDPVMDPEKNPLASLPAVPRYQIMTVLAMMWSFIFCAMFGWWMLFPYWVIGHILLLAMGAFFTNYTFKNANKPTHRDLYRSQDGTHVMHDDIWGERVMDDLKAFVGAILLMILLFLILFGLALIRKIGS